MKMTEKEKNGPEGLASTKESTTPVAANSAGTHHSAALHLHAAETRRDLPGRTIESVELDLDLELALVESTAGTPVPIDISVYVESVSAEYSRGLHALREVGPGVTVFGSARTRPGERAYTEAMTAGRLLAQAGLAVITGGGGGIMEAANRGAALGGGGSIGMPIVLPYEEKANPFVGLSVSFDHFPARKTCLIQACDAVIVFVGGFGTLDELFEVLTLIQTGKLDRIPVILVGSYYWSGLVEWLSTSVAGASCIGGPDLDLLTIVDSPERAVEEVLERLQPQVSSMPPSTVTSEPVR